MKKVNMKKGDMILEIGGSVSKNVLIDGDRNAARLRYLGYLWRGWICPLNAYSLIVISLGRLQYLRFLWVMLGQYDAYSLIVSSFSVAYNIYNSYR